MALRNYSITHSFSRWSVTCRWRCCLLQSACQRLTSCRRFPPSAPQPAAQLTNSLQEIHTVTSQHRHINRMRNLRNILNLQQPWTWRWTFDPENLDFTPIVINHGQHQEGGRPKLLLPCTREASLYTRARPSFRNEGCTTTKGSSDMYTTMYIIVYLTPPGRGFPLEFCNGDRVHKTRTIPLQMSKSVTTCPFV